MFRSKGMAGQCQNCHKLQILAKMARLRIENSKGSWNARGMKSFRNSEHLTPGRSSVPRTAPNRFEKGQGGLCSEFVEVVKLIILQSKLQSATKYYPLLPGIPLRTTKSDMHYALPPKWKRINLLVREAQYLFEPFAAIQPQANKPGTQIFAPKVL